MYGFTEPYSSETELIACPLPFCHCNTSILGKPPFFLVVYHTLGIVEQGAGSRLVNIEKSRYPSHRLSTRIPHQLELRDGSSGMSTQPKGQCDWAQPRTAFLKGGTDGSLDFVPFRVSNPPFS